MTKARALLVVATAGMAAGIGSVATAAAPYLINLSGATLLRNFLVSPASTNDFLDLDGDSALPPDQLAPSGTALTTPGQLWQVQYRGTGSVNGFIELQAWGQTFATQAGDAEILTSLASEGGFHNRTVYINNGAATGPANAANPGSAPRRSTLDGTFMVTTSTSPGNAGILVDAAPVDVPTLWATRKAGTPSSKLKPVDPGYGSNPLTALNPDGSPTSQTNQLPPLAPYNTNFSAPDANTIYDTLFTIAPVAATVNFGVGYSQMLITDIKYLMGSGRMKSGENLMAVTRDVGSGTRNAFMNGIGQDPSWGYGDNIGLFTSSSTRDLLGPNFQPTNKGSNSRVEGTMPNHRLAVGYAGAERGVNGSWLSASGIANDPAARFEVLGVLDDVRNGTVDARPTIRNVLHIDGSGNPLANPGDGYAISGPSIFATIGDPRAESAALGGDANGNPLMANENAAAYINNITRSIANFKAVPNAPENDFSPAEYLAANFILVSSQAWRKNIENPRLLELNPGANLGTRSEALNRSVLRLPCYQSFNTFSYGVVPTRTSLTLPAAYTDGVSNQNHYVAQNGALLTYGTALRTLDPAGLNRIAGDFNSDGQRNWNDAAEMIAAFNDRANGLPNTWRSGTVISIELIGDFTGDGNFNADDVRYWADGLALDPATLKLDRAEGFLRVDQAFGGNFFATTLATGAAYTAGASAADIAGPSQRWTKGYRPIGHDGVINAFDIDYICRNFGDFANQDDAFVMDLSADVNGDRVVDINDVCRTLNFLNTIFGDVNLDGVVNGADLSIAQANLGNPGGWAQGDVDCDGVVDSADVAIIAAGGVNLCCPADLNGDGFVNAGDLASMLGAWGPGSGPADLNGDGQVNSGDLAALLGAWGPCGS